LRVGIRSISGAPAHALQGRRQLAAAAIIVRKISVRSGSGVRTLTLNVSQSRRRSEPAVPAIIEELTRRSGVIALEWRYLD
jgi:hypothetical protein